MPASEKFGEHWDAVERIFLTVQAASSAEKITSLSTASPPRSASIRDSHSNNRNQQLVSSVSATESESDAPVKMTKKVKMKVKKIKSKKSSSAGVDYSLPSLIRVGNGPSSQQVAPLQDQLLVSRSVAESAGDFPYIKHYAPFSI